MGLQFTVKDAPDLTIPEDTICRARLEEIKLREFSWTDYKDKDRPGQPVSKTGQSLEWWWEVIEGTHKGRKVKGQCDPEISNHPRNKFRRWAEAILDREIPEGMNIDTDDLTGQVADVSIGHRADKKDPAKKYEFVDEVMPVTGGLSASSEPPF